MESTCRHAACNCRVKEQDFCGPDCEAAAARHSRDEGDEACSCGHPNCYEQSDSSLISELEEP